VLVNSFPYARILSFVLSINSLIVCEMLYKVYDILRNCMQVLYLISYLGLNCSMFALYFLISHSVLGI